MSDIATKLEAKKRELEELRRSRSGSSCSRVHSNEADVRREIKVEQLVDEIRKLKEQLDQES